MKILLNYNITSEQFEQLAENQDFDAMLRIGRILNIMTTLAEAEVSYLACHPLLADVRRSEVLRVKSRLADEAILTNVRALAGTLVSSNAIPYHSNI